MNSKGSESNSITISCLGDLLPADSAYSLGTGIGSSAGKILEHSGMMPFSDSDLVICNLEGPLVMDPNASHLPFAGNPSILKFMKKQGIDMVSLANNHLPDHGDNNIHNTIKLLKDSEIDILGINNRLSSICIKNVKEKKIAFAAFNAVKDHPDDTIIAPLDPEKLTDAIVEINKYKPDYIVFILHWGNEYVPIPSPGQVSLAHELIDRGVNVIFGHHPHVIQPVERYRKGLIFYSLGNFMFDMFWSREVRYGLQADVFFHQDEIDYRVLPFRIGNNFLPDYKRGKSIIPSMVKNERKFAEYSEGPVELYEKVYHKISRNRRRQARITMKIYLILHIFTLSKASLKILLSNTLSKTGLRWKKV